MAHVMWSKKSDIPYEETYIKIIMDTLDVFITRLTLLVVKSLTYNNSYYSHVGSRTHEKRLQFYENNTKHRSLNKCLLHFHNTPCYNLVTFAKSRLYLNWVIVGLKHELICFIS